MKAMSQPKIVCKDPSPAATRANADSRLRTLTLNSIVTKLNGLPYPVQFRNQDAVNEWRNALSATEAGQLLWRKWSQPETPTAECIADINLLLGRMVGPLDNPDDAAQWRAEAAHLALQCGVNIGLELKQGTLIEPTPALDTLLLNSDFDGSLPMRLVCPPFAAQYLRFGEEAAQMLAPPSLAGAPRIVDGVFCFLSQPAGTDENDFSLRQLELSFICKSADRYKGYISIRGPVGSANMTISDWVSSLISQDL